MQKIKSMIKKIGAISTGAAFLGATLTGALAADLKDYPAPFADVTAKKFNYLGVVGTDSAAVDNLGLSDITAGLSAVKVPGTGTSGTVSVVGGDSEDVPIGNNIASTNQLDKDIDDSDVSNLLDGTISFQGTDYDVSEVVELGVSTANTTIQTSIAGPYTDDDYEDRVVLVSASDAIRYYYAFDETIQINKTKSSDALNLKFLGKTLKITSVDADSKFTANVGTENYVKNGETVTSSGKQVKLIDVGSGGNVIVSVDGVQDVIDASTTKTINGLEIKNDATFYTDTKAERSAWLILGTDATESYTDGDPYVGENKDDPKWVWDIGNLNTKGTTIISNNATNAAMIGTGSGSFIGVESDWNYRDGSDSDAIEVGDCIDLPNSYVSICLDSLTVADDSYMKMVFELAESVDLTSDARVPGLGTANTLHITASKEDGIRLLQSGLSPNNLTKNTDTNELWLTGNHNVSIYYKDKDKSNKKTFAGNASNVGNLFWAEIRFDDTKDSNIQFNTTLGNMTTLATSGDVAGGDDFLFTLVPQGDTSSELEIGTDNIVMHWARTAGTTGVASLGVTKSSEEAAELAWNPFNAVRSNLGTKDEDHRTRYGVVVKDPKSAGASDKVELMIPGDHVQANVVVKGLSAAGGTASASTGNALATYDVAPSGMLDTQVTTPSNYNLILVGGPAVNRLSAQFLGVTYPAYGEASGLKSGEAVLSLKDNGDKVALIVAGWAGEDTQRAAAVLKNSEAYKGKLTGSEVKVSGTTSSPTVVSA
ncbi:MAG: hypothetical protein AABW45_01610 [Nanoarchaeota archaeon]|mgnify:CR=1 FL=1